MHIVKENHRLPSKYYRKHGPGLSGQGGVLKRGKSELTSVMVKESTSLGSGNQLLNQTIIEVLP